MPPPIALSAFRTTTAADDNVPSVPATRPFELSDMKYASCYCEENIYCMVRDHVAPERRGEYFVVFISNREKCVALNFQKASPTPGTPVYWDYHVILLHHPASHPHTITVYDLDTALPFGLPWHTYFERTCSAPLAPAPAPAPTVPSYAHDRHYKLVPAADYLRLFSSTRAHMKRVLAGENTWSWVMEPPAWPAIRSEEGGENALERFLDFAHGGDAFGRVYGERGFMAHLLALVGGRG